MTTGHHRNGNHTPAKPHLAPMATELNKSVTLAAFFTL